MTIRVNAELFRLCYAGVSKEEYRPYLGGVHIEPHHDQGAIMVATDGRRLICVHDAEAECDQSALVHLPKFALALCAAKRGKELGIDRAILTIDVDANIATVAREHLNRQGNLERSEPVVTAHRVIIKGDFPEWRKVTPKGPFEGSVASTFNSKLLSEMAAFGDKLPTDSRSGVPMYMLRQKDVGPDNPVIVRWSGVHNVFAVLMPMRGDIETDLPSFLALPAEAAAAAE